jgi:AraC-like DNA-binding protein
MRTWTYNDLIEPSGMRFRVQRLRINEECFPAHQHDFGELVILFSGTAVHQTEDGDCPLAAGDVFYIRPRHAHGYTKMCQAAMCNVLFDPELYLRSVPHLHRLPGFHALFHLEPLLRGAQTPQNRLRLDPDALKRAEGWVDRLIAECDERPPGYEGTVHALFSLLVAELARSCDLHEAGTSRHLAGLARVAAHIETHFAQPVRLEDLAGMACMSRASLERAFNRCYGTSPIDYLLSCRVAHARALLESTDLSVTEIARRSGFNDSNYFTRKFRERAGAAPRAYRRGTRG